MQRQQLSSYVDLLVTHVTQNKAAKNSANNFIVKIPVAIAGAALGLITIPTDPARAATLSWDFKVDITDGVLAGNTYSGFLSYDNSDLTGVGLENLGIEDGLTISFNWLGQTFTEKHDIQFPTFPTLSFQNGNLLTLNWVVGNFSSGFSIGRDQQRSSIGFSYQGIATGVGSGNVTYSRKTIGPEPISEPVNVPESSPIAGFSLLSLGFLSRKTLCFLRSRMSDRLRRILLKQEVVSSTSVDKISDTSLFSACLPSRNVV